MPLRVVVVALLFVGQSIASRDTPQTTRVSIAHRYTPSDRIGGRYQYLPFIVSGLTTGSVYGLLGIGLVLTYKTSGVFNFAHGAVAALGAIVFYTLHVDLDLPWWLAAFLSVMVAGPVFGLLMAPMAGRLAKQDTFTRIATRVQPSVVGITSFVEDPAWTLERLTAERGMAWIEAHTEELLHPGYRKLRSGSGFLVSDDGYVLTADHLVRDEKDEVVPLVSVELRDGRHVKARVVGAEPIDQ